MRHNSLNRDRGRDHRAGVCFLSPGAMVAWGLLFLSLFFLPRTEAAAAEIASLQKIRYQYTSDYTRVVLDLDRPVKYEVCRLKKDRSAGLPPRIYIDLHQTHCAGDLPKKIALEEGPVQWIRASRHKKNTVRLVLDLRQAEHYKVFRLEQPDRIVMDLWWKKKGDRAEKKPAGLPLIVLDPGHGGVDPGATGKRGSKEKDVVFSIALELKRILEVRGKARVLLTRSGDRFLSLGERTRFANSRNADLFVSIHANASSSRKVRGIETYYLDNTTDRASIRLAKLENKSAGKAIDDLQCILRDLRLNSNANESNLLARTVQKSLTGHLRSKYRGIEDLGAKGNLFFVLIGAHMPSILVEVSFLSNPAEEKRLRTKAYRKAAARGIADGIEKYLDQPSAYRLVAGPPGRGR